MAFLRTREDFSFSFVYDLYFCVCGSVSPSFDWTFTNDLRAICCVVKFFVISFVMCDCSSLVSSLGWTFTTVFWLAASSCPTVSRWNRRFFDWTFTVFWLPASRTFVAFASVMLSTNRGTKPMMSAEDRRRREAQRRIDEGLPAKRKYNKLTEQLQEVSIFLISLLSLLSFFVFMNFKNFFVLTGSGRVPG